MISITSSARRVHYFKVKALKEQEEMQARLEKLRREVEESCERLEKVAFQEALARKARIAQRKRQIAKVSCSCGSSLRNLSTVGSTDDNLTKIAGMYGVWT